MDFKLLVEYIQKTSDLFVGNAAKSINVSLTFRNWCIGMYIAEFEQNGQDRATYGEKLLKNLEERLSSSTAKGLNERRFREYRQFYFTYPQIRRMLSAEFVSQVLSPIIHEIRRLPSAELKGDYHLSEKQNHNGSDKNKVISQDPESLIRSLSYSHFVELIKISDPLKRVFYEMECMKGTWSIPELKRQIESLYFERSGLSKDKKKLSELVNQKAVQLSPRDVINDPITMEFLGLSDRALVTETDLEQAILDHLQMFLLELGHGFCFEARQKRILIDDEYYFIDLVFYHRILKCHILVDLKTEKFKHSHVGQMNTYLEYYKNEVLQEGDNPPVGILLCTDKGNALVKYATAGLEKSVFVKKYLIELPSKEEIENYIQNEIQ